MHIVTVNDYLALRDSEWMGQIYKYLGLTVGVIQNQMSNAERRVQYECDITFGTANEFGFDYLRDNMAQQVEDRVSSQLPLCDNRRGRLDSDRRGEDAADYLGAGRLQRA